MSSAPHNIPEPDSDDICGWVAYHGGDVEAFKREFGGQTLYIPISISRDHRIARAIGFEVATRLCQHLARDTFAVPTGRPAERRMLVLILSLAEIAIGQIASAADITTRAVSRIRAQLRDEGLLPRRATKPDNIYENERY